MRFLFTLLLIHCTLANANAVTSNSLIDVTADGKTLIVANRDNDSVSVVDLKTRQVLHQIPVGHHPEGVSWIANGPLAIVTLYGEDKLAFVNAESGKLIETLAVDNEPYGVVVTADGKRAYVSHDYPGLVSEIDLVGHKVLRTIKAGEWTRHRHRQG